MKIEKILSEEQLLNQLEDPRQDEWYTSQYTYRYIFMNYNGCSIIISEKRMIEILKIDKIYILNCKFPSEDDKFESDFSWLTHPKIRGSDNHRTNTAYEDNQITYKSYEKLTENNSLLIYYNKNIYLISKLEDALAKDEDSLLDEMIIYIKHSEYLKKKSNYLKEKKFNDLKKQVELFEKILDVEKSLEEEKISREPIAEDVKIFVWRRDEGKCVNCNSQKNLEFDHIIPFSKGGSNTARNIQILCQDCNRKKADKI